VKTATQTSTVFDQDHYQRLIQARGDTIRRIVTQLKPALNLSTALDAGCGLGFFSQILQECGLNVSAFDGRESNVVEGRSRFPQVHFEIGDVQDSGILRLGKFDLVLCFGLLYHLESPLLAIRNLRSLSRHTLLLESMCLPDANPWMLLREERSLDDQSLTDLAFYATEGCLVKMLYRAGFASVHRLAQLPDHDDFRDTPGHRRRRTVLLATSAPLAMQGLQHISEPVDASDPWSKEEATTSALPRRLKVFLGKPAKAKYSAIARRVHRAIPALPIPIRLPFGGWWLAKSSALDYELLTNGFESAEIRFVQRFLRPGMTVLDIGAHHGLYTLLASKRVGKPGKVIAFEPSPRERLRLEKHLRLNRIRNVELHPFALGSQEGNADLYLADGVNDWCNSLRRPEESSGQTVRVQVRRLDDVVSQSNLERVDFMKVDVEGAELDTFKGATELLSLRPRPVVMAEAYDIRTRPWGYDAREIVRFLANLNYQWFSLNDDGTLAAISPDLATYDANLVAIPVERTQEVHERLSKE